MVVTEMECPDKAELFTILTSYCLKRVSHSILMLLLKVLFKNAATTCTLKAKITLLLYIFFFLAILHISTEKLQRMPSNYRF